MNRQLKIPDFPHILDKLVKSGVPTKDIAKHIGVSDTYVIKIRNESSDVPDAWVVAYKLLDLYVRNIGVPVPFYGDHNE